jgi:hypothetical protein
MRYHRNRAGGAAIGEPGELNGCADGDAWGRISGRAEFSDAQFGGGHRVQKTAS